MNEFINSKIKLKLRWEILAELKVNDINMEIIKFHVNKMFVSLKQSKI